MNIKRITTIQLIITFALAISLFFFINYKISLGILLGSALGYFNFFFLNKRINDLTDEELPDLKKIVKKNRNFRYIVLLLTLIISGLLPQVFNIIAVCLSVLINKLSVYIDLIFNKNN